MSGRRAATCLATWSSLHRVAIGFARLSLSHRWIDTACSAWVGTFVGVAVAVGASGLWGATVCQALAEGSVVAISTASLDDGEDSSAAGDLIAAPDASEFERKLRAGAIGVLKSLRYWTRALTRTFSYVATRWADWSAEAAGFLVILLVAPLFDRGLLTVWRRDGFRAACTTGGLGVAVYLRLLFDRRMPFVGKALLGCAAIYCGAPADLLPDGLRPFGLVDDVVVLALCSNCFVRICPVRVLDEQARRARTRWVLTRRRRNSTTVGKLPTERQ